MKRIQKIMAQVGFWWSMAVWQSRRQWRSWWWEARRHWHGFVGIRWQRLQGRVLGLYFRSVTSPVRDWVACGCPEDCVPRLPWWHDVCHGKPVIRHDFPAPEHESGQAE
jgi:hypothetical protein